MVMDEDGRLNFAKLMFGRTGSHYFAFDLLLLDKGRHGVHRPFLVWVPLVKVKPLATRLLRKRKSADL